MTNMTPIWWLLAAILIAAIVAGCTTRQEDPPWPTQEQMIYDLAIRNVPSPPRF